MPSHKCIGSQHQSKYISLSPLGHWINENGTSHNELHAPEVSRLKSGNAHLNSEGGCISMADPLVLTG